MAHFTTEACVKCKYTDCAAVCPVSCFNEGANMLVINPETCIDCGVCIPECPVDAIKTELDLNIPQEEKEFWLSYNARKARIWPQISESKDELETADEFSKIKDKKCFLHENETNKS